MTHNAGLVEIDRLKDIISLVMHAAEGEDVQQVLQRIAEAARELIGARYAALGVPDGHGKLRYFKVAGMTEQEVSMIDHPPVGAGLLGAIMNERETLRLTHMTDDPRSVGFPHGHPHMDSLLGVPIMVGDELFGMFYLTDREDGEPFVIEDQWLLETLAGYAALAITGSQLREKAERLTLLEERQRIGMELHDGIIQSLYAVGMMLELMRNNQDASTERLNQAIDGLNEVIEEVRTYITDLKTRNYEAKTAHQALEDVIARLYVPAHISITMDVPHSPLPISTEGFESVCFIAREALSNVLRHSQANNVTIRCWLENNHLHLVIRDNGVGFDPEPKKNGTGGLGLRNIMARVSQLHGRARLESTPGEGTALIISIPL